jgi:hypothetical protein
MNRFSGNSANDHYQLRIQSADMFIDQLNKLTSHVPQITDMNFFKNASEEQLAYILKFNQSDKSTEHNYHILYSFILDELGRLNNLNMLEIGIGTNNPTKVSTMGASGRPGASLFAWNQYLPNSNIYGADVDEDILFNTERIKTFYVDQLKYDTFKSLEQDFKYDVIIDDGYHSIGANLNTLLFALDNIKVGGWIVIEDISSEYYDNWYAIDFILKQKNKYNTYLIRAKTHFMYAVKCVN